MLKSGKQAPPHPNLESAPPQKVDSPLEVNESRRCHPLRMEEDLKHRRPLLIPSAMRIIVLVGAILIPITLYLTALKDHYTIVFCDIC